MLNNFSDNEFTCKLREYLIKKHNVEYTGKFRTVLGTEDNPTFYSLEWLENKQDRPMVMLGDFENGDAFFKYVCKEIRDRKFYKKQVFNLVHTDKEGRT